MTTEKPLGVKYLHHPSRANNLETTEEHLDAAQNLARALWLLLDDGGYNNDDPRDAQAVAELASAVADHASAASVAYHKETVDRMGKRAACPPDAVAPCACHDLVNHRAMGASRHKW